jgi:hypothetical protein
VGYAPPRERRSASEAAQGEAQDGSSSARREGRRTRAGGFGKKFAGKVEEKVQQRSEHPNKPLKILAFDEEARFGLINWRRRRYCPRGFRPPYVSGEPTTSVAASRRL